MARAEREFRCYVRCSTTIAPFVELRRALAFHVRKFMRNCRDLRIRQDLGPRARIDGRRIVYPVINSYPRDSCPEDISLSTSQSMRDGLATG